MQAPSQSQQQPRHPEPVDLRRDEHPVPPAANPPDRDFDTITSSLESSLWAGLDSDQRQLRTLILEYYTQSLSKLVSCDHVDQEEAARTPGADSTATNDRRAAGFDAFRDLAAVSAANSMMKTGTNGPLDGTGAMPSPTSSSWVPAQILHIALLAWASRHWLNKGEARYEAASEVWGKRAETMLRRLFEESDEEIFHEPPSDPQAAGMPERGLGENDHGLDRASNHHAVGRSAGSARQESHDHGVALTTLAASIMIAQWKVSLTHITQAQLTSCYCRPVVATFVTFNRSCASSRNCQASYSSTIFRGVYPDRWSFICKPLR